MMQLKNTVIYLFGSPATGKYTIGKILAAAAGAKLVDNHYINNPIFGLIELDGKTPLPQRVWDNADKVRDAVFDTIAYLSPPDYSFILTNVLFDDNPEDHEILKYVIDLAAMRKAHFVPVRLLCSVEAMKSRIVTEDRKHRMKQTCPHDATTLYQTRTVLNSNHPNLIELDTSRYSAEEAAKHLFKAITEQLKN